MDINIFAEDALDPKPAPVRIVSSPTASTAPVKNDIPIVTTSVRCDPPPVTTPLKGDSRPATVTTKLTPSATGKTQDISLVCKEYFADAENKAEKNMVSYVPPEERKNWFNPLLGVGTCQVFNFSV